MAEPDSNGLWRPQALCRHVFHTYPGYYFTGDGARRDADGYYWITGRVDDVLNVSGHRMGTAEVESALVLHPAVAEAAVVGYPHDVKGQGIYCFVTLMQGTEGTDELRQALEQMVRTEIGAIAKQTSCSGHRPCQKRDRQDHAPYFERLQRMSSISSVIPAH